MAVEIECVTEVSDELAEAFARLMPQLSPRLGALSRQAMERVVCSDGAALFAARLDGRIAGVLTLVWYPRAGRHGSRMWWSMPQPAAAVPARHS